MQDGKEEKRVGWKLASSIFTLILGPKTYANDKGLRGPIPGPKKYQ